MAEFTARFESSTVAACSDALQRLSDAFVRITPAAVVKAAKVIQSQARSNASHRPGPRVITGALRNSILTMGGAGPQAGPVNTALPVGCLHVVLDHRPDRHLRAHPGVGR